MLSIKEQILEKPNMHIGLFTCWALAIASFFVPWFSSEPFLAAGFVVSALIDLDT